MGADTENKVMNFSMLRAKSGVFALVILLCAPFAIVRGGVLRQ